MGASLVEYLYIDRARLSAYFEQVSGPTHFDKVPVYNGAASLKGPSIERHETAHARGFTTHEQTRALLEYLSQAGLVDGAPATAVERWREPPVFRYERRRAVKAAVPAGVSELPPLAVWICGAEPPTSEAEKLFLIEDFVSPDFDGAHSREMTGYSSLIALVESVVGLDHPGAWFDANYARLPDRASRLTREFAVRPHWLLESLGATLGVPRGIRSLYRVRQTLFEEADEFAPVTIGYPIFIEALPA